MSNKVIGFGFDEVIAYSPPNINLGIYSNTREAHNASLNKECKIAILQGGILAYVSNEYQLKENEFFCNEDLK